MRIKRNWNWTGKNRIKTYCKICKKKIRNKSKIRGLHFCSMKCSIQYTKLKNTRHCKNCGKSFIMKRSRIKTQIFCSRQCSGIWTAKNLVKFRDTSIELMIEQELKKRNISYQKQVPILTTAIVDFLLPNKIIIQCDGNFWHSRKINKGKDIAQDTVLQFNGYKVYRFTETEIKKSAKRCLEKVHFTDDNKK